MYLTLWRLLIVPADHETSNLYIPVPPQQQSQTLPTRQASHGQSAQNEHMHVDDTKDRIYIHDLDAELAELESDSEKEKLIFIPDIERKLDRIPKHVLMEQRDNHHAGGQLVLYRPRSALIPPANMNGDYGQVLVDKLRKDERAMHGEQRIGQIQQPHEMNEPETAHGFTEVDYAGHQGQDPDAMEIE